MPAFVKISYGTVEYPIPESWYQAWLSDPKSWSSVADVLDTYWPEYRSMPNRYGATWDRIHDLIGCYNIGHSKEEVLARCAFWRVRWGAPHRVLLNAVMLINRTIDHLHDPRYPESRYVGGLCRDGWRDFVGRLTAGQEATTHASRPGKPATCRLSIHVRNDDPRYAKDWKNPCRNEPGVDNRKDDCVGWKRNAEESSSGGHDYVQWERGPNPDDPGSEWAGPVPPEVEGMSPWWYHTETELPPGWSLDRNDNLVHKTSTDYVHAAQGRPRTGVKEDGVVRGSTLNGMGGDFGLTIHPSHVSWLGDLCDELMNSARILLDYHRSTGSRSAWESGSMLARYVLAEIAALSRLIIHELGHSYFGGGHLKHDLLCFEVSAWAWACRVSGLNGLPKPGRHYLWYRYRDRPPIKDRWLIDELDKVDGDGRFVGVYCERPSYEPCLARVWVDDPYRDRMYRPEPSDGVSAKWGGGPAPGEPPPDDVDRPERLWE